MKRVLVVGSMVAVVAALGASAGGARGHGRRQLSRVVFPPSAPAIRMDHALPAHRALRCTACHADATQSRRASDTLAPSEESCRPCHAEQTDRSAPPDEERCGVCHVGFEESASAGGAPRVPAAAPVPARIHFSHRRHAREGVRCLDCHRGITDPDGDVGRHLPTMRQCFECHGGPSPTAPGECTTCHLARPDGRMRTDYPEGSMTPPRWLRGMAHDRDWIVRHRWVGADEGTVCASCHTESDCADCHDGRIRPRRLHPNDYLTIHAQMARRDEPRCTSCHSAQTFCSECHSRLGVSQIAAPNVRSRDRFHPPPEIWVRGPVQHGREARRSMSACVSCHAERDCVSCHGVLGIGAGLSPHPVGFAADCGRLLRANDRACRSCHGDVASLRAVCR